MQGPGISPWILAISAILWAFQLHVVKLITILLIPKAEYREFWLYRAAGSPSYFYANAGIAFCLLTLTTIEFARAIRKPRQWINAILFCAILTFVAGFSFDLAFIGTHHLDSEWHAKAASDEQFDLSRVYLGLVVGDPAGSKARVWLESCEEVLLDMPSDESVTQIVVVEERRGRYSNERLLSAVAFVTYDDLCTFLFSEFRGDNEASCLTRHCS